MAQVMDSSGFNLAFVGLPDNESPTASALIKADKRDRVYGSPDKDVISIFNNCLMVPS
jgi:hypothetical protein